MSIGVTDIDSSGFEVRGQVAKRVHSHDLQYHTRAITYFTHRSEAPRPGTKRPHVAVEPRCRGHNGGVEPIIPYASLGRRALAYLADVGVLVGFVLASQFLLSGVSPVLKMSSPTGIALHGWVLLTVSLPCLAYFALQTALGRGQTLGMRALRIRVERADGGELALPRAFVRSFLLLLPFEINHAALFYPVPILAPGAQDFRPAMALVYALMAIYAGMVILTRRRQSAHDLLTDTVVVRL
jgi:uncharacterized RDD family membrane protein YckC